MASVNFHDVIVIGAGAAGLMCALTGAQLGARVLVIDHNDAPGKKILISGGGRCNFTNMRVGAENFLSSNPHFCKSALSRYTPQDFIGLIERHNIAWHEKTLGQLFCDGSAKQIVEMLMNDCREAKVEFIFGNAAQNIQRDATSQQFQLNCDGQGYECRHLVVASGGLSIPKLGASAFGYDIARQFGLKVVEPRPALVPLKLGPEEALFRELSGVATPVIASSGKSSFSEAALFTHKGLSGPAILQISSYLKPGGSIEIDFLPEHENDWLLRQKEASTSKSFVAVLREMLPQRLADALGEKLNMAGPLHSLSNPRCEQIGRTLKHWQFNPSGSEGFAKAEVTIGGVSTRELSSSTMQSQKVPGLYFVGEAVDVTGWLGGYNFQWAWASGYAAGLNIAQSAKMQ